MTSPADPFSEFRFNLDRGTNMPTTPGKAGNYGLEQYGADVGREVARRRKMLLEKNPGLALNDDSLDAILRNTVTGRLNRARGNSASTALGQAFDPTAPIGRDMLLGD